MGDRGFAACRGGEAGVVGEGAGLAVERADVDDLRAHRSREHVIIVALPAEGEAGLFVRHAYCSLFVILSARRARLSSRPSSTSTSKIPGEVARPVSAARRGCANWPSLTSAAPDNPLTACPVPSPAHRSAEHPPELPSLMRHSYAVSCYNK